MVGIESYFFNVSQSVTHLHTHTHAHTLGRTPLDEGSARRRDLCLTTHNNHKRYTSTPPAGFEPAIPAAEQLLMQKLKPQIGSIYFRVSNIIPFFRDSKVLLVGRLIHDFVVFVSRGKNTGYGFWRILVPSQNL